MAVALRQNRPGTAKQDLYSWSPQDMDDMNTTLVCHQYIQQLIRADNSDVAKIVACPDEQDPDVWQYEHIRQICMELNGLVLALEPGCTKEKFPTMFTKSSEMQFLCAVYNPPRSTDAMTYIVNTLDHTIGQLCSEKMFPSRLVVCLDRVLMEQSLQTLSFGWISSAVFLT
eukprot:m.103052 g.103052  ORF g.103052 m.103052 type:complete len:171 (+) comp16836_c0_seq5:171-683(+)